MSGADDGFTAAGETGATYADLIAKSDALSGMRIAE